MYNYDPCEKINHLKLRNLKSSSVQWLNDKMKYLDFDIFFVFADVKANFKYHVWVVNFYDIDV